MGCNDFLTNPDTEELREHKPLHCGPQTHTVSAMMLNVLQKTTEQNHLLSVNKPNFNISSSADLITLQYSGLCHPYGNKTACVCMSALLHREQQ